MKICDFAERGKKILTKINNMKNTYKPDITQISR